MSEWDWEVGMPNHHQGRQRLMGIAAEVHHGEDGVGHGRGHEGHEQKPEEVEDGRHDDGVTRLHGTG